MTDIKTMNEQYKYCKKITNILFSVEKTKKLKIYKMVKKSVPVPAFIHTTQMHEDGVLLNSPPYLILRLQNCRFVRLNS